MNDLTPKAAPIQQQLMRTILLTSGLALLLTGVAFFIYEYLSFRQTLKNQLTMLGEIIAANSTAALAFDSQDDAQEILGALRANRHVVAAGLYDKQGQLFAIYPANTPRSALPPSPVSSGYQFKGSYLEGFQPVVQGRTTLGSLYLKSDMNEMYQRFGQYSLIVALVLGLSLALAILLSRRLQERITQPIQDLAQTATLVSREHTYTVRATKYQDDEIGVLTDAFNHMLTEIDRQNSEILAWNQQLEDKIKARTSELERINTELTSVNSKLVKSNHDLEQFAYVASHDLQEPLRKIQTFAELADLNLSDPVNARQHLRKIFQAAERMSSLIKSVLHYSRLSNVTDGYTTVDLNEIIGHIRADFELLLMEKNASLTTSSLPIVPGIPTQLHQLFSNLIHNAIKFSDRPPQISIQAITHAAGSPKLPSDLGASQPYVELLVQDNGIGFNTHYAGKIFTIFQRLHHQKDYPGTGIGLALVKKIVENHQGSIQVQSELGQGTTFQIYLPLN